MGDLESSMPETSGEAAAAALNRERRTRLEIVAAFNRLGTPQEQWPDFVRTFHADPQQRIEYEAVMTPFPYQPPDFDRLNQSLQEWVKTAEQGWERYLRATLRDWEDWVSSGIDEPIAEPKRPRGAGKKRPTVAGARGTNTPLGRRYEWAARYLLDAPLKEIAAADEDPSTVGRVARELIRSAGWLSK